MQTEETKNSVDVLKAFVIHALHQTCAEINPFVRLEMIRRYKDFLEGLPDEVPADKLSRALAGTHGVAVDIQLEARAAVEAGNPSPVPLP